LTSLSATITTLAITFRAKDGSKGLGYTIAHVIVRASSREWFVELAANDCDVAGRRNSQTGSAVPGLQDSNNDAMLGNEDFFAILSAQN